MCTFSRKEYVFIAKKGFTLAEVLVTLAIIGVVAALTIPTLMSNIENAGTASRVKKANSMLNQAVKMYMVDNDCIGDLTACGLFSGDDKPGPTWTALKPYFKVIKNCGTATNQGCFAPGVRYKYLNGRDARELDNWDPAKGLLADGSSIMIHDNNGNCTTDTSRTGTTPLKNTCGAIWIDINGYKGPNKYGRDVFHWTIVKSGTVYPLGALDHKTYTDVDGTPYCDPNNPGDSSTPGGGYGCTAKIIREGKVNY